MWHCAIFCYCIYFQLSVCSVWAVMFLVVSISALDCLEGLLSKMTCYLSSGMLKSLLTQSLIHSVSQHLSPMYLSDVLFWGISVWLLSIQHTVIIARNTITTSLLWLCWKHYYVLDCVCICIMGRHCSHCGQLNFVLVGWATVYLAPPIIGLYFHYF